MQAPKRARVSLSCVAVVCARRIQCIASKSAMISDLCRLRDRTPPQHRPPARAAASQTGDRRERRQNNAAPQVRHGAGAELPGRIGSRRAGRRSQSAHDADREPGKRAFSTIGNSEAGRDWPELTTPPRVGGFIGRGPFARLNSASASPTVGCHWHTFNPRRARHVACPAPRRERPRRHRLMPGPRAASSPAPGRSMRGPSHSSSE